VNSTVPSPATQFFARLARLARFVAMMLALPCLAVLAGCGASGGGQAVQGGDAGAGKRLVTQYQCGACHAIPGIPGAGGDTGPSLEHLGRLSYIAGGIPNRPERLVAWLRDPPALKPGTPMPSLGLSEQEARDMAAYLYSLR
jgi:cytochrome c1